MTSPGRSVTVAAFLDALLPLTLLPMLARLSLLAGASLVLPLLNRRRVERRQRQEKQANREEHSQGTANAVNQG